MRKGIVVLSVIFCFALSFNNAVAETPEDVVSMAIAPDTGHVFAWYRDGNVSSGTSDDLARHRQLYGYILPRGKTPNDIVAIVITKTKKRNFTSAYYRDGTYSQGKSDNLAEFNSFFPYTLPEGKTPNDIVGMGYASDSGLTFAWYRDGTVSAARQYRDDFSAGRAPYRYRLPSGKTPNDIVGMSTSTDGHHFAWYRDGTVSAGTSDNLESFRTPYAYHLPQTLGGTGGITSPPTTNIVALATAQDTGHVYAWYSNNTCSSGTSENLIQYQKPYSYTLAYGKTPNDVVDIIVYDKINSSSVAYYLDGTFSSGNSDNLDRSRQSGRYILPQGKTPRDIVGMGANFQNRRLEIYTWYRDGTVSIGDNVNLAGFSTPAPYTLPQGKRPSDIIAMAVAQNGDCYAWYNDGTVSAGVFDNLESKRRPYSFRY